MSVRRGGLSVAGERREVERRAGRRKAFLERNLKDMIIRVNLQGCEARGPRRMSQPLNPTRVRGSLSYNDYPWSSRDPRWMIEPGKAQLEMRAGA